MNIAALCPVKFNYCKGEGNSSLVFVAVVANIYRVQDEDAESVYFNNVGTSILKGVVQAIKG